MANQPAYTLAEQIEIAYNDLADAYASLQAARGADRGAAARQYDRAAAKLARLQAEMAEKERTHGPQD